MQKLKASATSLTCLLNSRVQGFAEFGFWKKEKKKNLKLHKNEGVEFVLVTKGLAAWEIEGKKQEVREGEVFWSFPWELHGGSDQSLSAYECCFLIFRLEKNKYSSPRLNGFHPVFNLEPLFVKEFSRLFNEKGTRIFSASELFKNLMLWTINELARMDHAYPEKIHSLGKCLLLESLECMEVFHQGNDLSRKSFIPLKVRQLTSELMLHPETTWTLEQMAEYCRLKRTQFSSYFFKATGDSPMMYLSRIRVEKARQLLLTSSLSITEVAMECGFNTSQYFSKVFRDYTGESPSQFTERNRDSTQ